MSTGVESGFIVMAEGENRSNKYEMGFAQIFVGQQFDGGESVMTMRERELHIYRAAGESQARSQYFLYLLCSHKRCSHIASVEQRPN